MRRFQAVPLVAVAALALGVLTGAAHATPPDCDETSALCTEPLDAIGYGGAYTGHDEPSLLFYSNTAGSGNSNLYRLQLPTDPKELPNQNGTGGTWNFQLHPGVLARHGALRQPVGARVHARSVHAGQRHEHLRRDRPGRARLHRQAPGHRVPRAPVLPAGLGSVAARGQLRRDEVVRRDGDLQPQPGPEHGHVQQRRLPEHRGAEPANFAFITKSGAPHAPPGPLDPTDGAFTPSSATDLFMGSGDRSRSTSTTAPPD